MSVIVAVRKQNTAAIASDTLASVDNLTISGDMRRYPQKIHKIGEAYVGIVGTMAHHCVLRSLIASKPDVFNFDDGDRIFETLRKIHPILRDEYYLSTKEDDKDQEYESNQLSGLVLSKAGIFSFSGYRGVSEYNCFWAAGSGMDFALGALAASYESEQSAKAVAETAVKAACKFDTDCGLPLESYELQLES